MYRCPLALSIKVFFFERFAAALSEMVSGRPRAIYTTWNDLLTPYTDPMSCFDDFFSLGGSKRTSGGLANDAEFVNPQCTQYSDKRFGTTQQLGFMTPELSPMDAAPRRESFALSENRSYNFSGSSEASSSFMSHSGCETPSMSTPSSSVSNSRRQSMMLPESQQCYISANSLSPSHGPQRRKMAVAADQCLLQESSPFSYTASTEEGSLGTDGQVGYTPRGEFTLLVNSFTGKAPRQWSGYAPQNDASLFYGSVAQHAQTDQSESLGPDLVTSFSNSMAAGTSQAFELNQPLFTHSQPPIFGGTIPQLGGDAYHTAPMSSTDVPPLGPAFEYQGEELVDGDNLSNDVAGGRPYLGHNLIREPVNNSSYHSKALRSNLLKPYTLSQMSDDDQEGSHSSSPIVKTRNKRHKPGQGAAWKPVYIRDKSHHCQFCKYACNRQEHLKRHEQSKHWKVKTGEETQMHPCEFAGCIDRKTGRHREIIARLDNLKAHYTKTHFKYGGSEKGGKNARKSMKAAHEMRLSAYDDRWKLLLDGKMNVNQEIKEYLHVWKMLGYSILETRDTKVKSVVADWPCADDETLQQYDPRWKALLDGTLTFDKAMSKGKDMMESEAQGLLGVTMLESEAMGIRDLDPRWEELLNRRMSVEQSEKLGVKQRNPLWIDLVDRRRAR